MTILSLPPATDTDDAPPAPRQYLAYYRDEGPDPRLSVVTGEQLVEDWAHAQYAGEPPAAERIWTLLRDQLVEATVSWRLVSVDREGDWFYYAAEVVAAGEIVETWHTRTDGRA